MEPVPCTEPHDAQLVSLHVRGDPPGSPRPPDDELRESAAAECVPALREMWGGDERSFVDAGFDITFALPSPDAWAGGERRVACIAFRPDGSPMIGSLAGRGPGLTPTTAAAPAGGGG